MALQGRTGSWSTSKNEVKFDNPIYETDLRVQEGGETDEQFHYRNVQYEDLQVQSTHEAIKYLQRQKLKKVFGVVVLCIVLAVIVSIIVYVSVRYSRGSSLDKVTKVNEPSRTEMVTGCCRFGLRFHLLELRGGPVSYLQQYSYSNSTEFGILATTIEQSFDTLFRNSSMKEMYRATKVVALSSGSVTVDAVIVFESNRLLVEQDILDVLVPGIKYVKTFNRILGINPETIIVRPTRFLGRTACEVRHIGEILGCDTNTSCQTVQCMNDGSFAPVQCQVTDSGDVVCYCVNSDGQMLVETAVTNQEPTGCGITSDSSIGWPKNQQRLSSSKGGNAFSVWSIGYNRDIPPSIFNLNIPSCELIRNQTQTGCKQAGRKDHCWIAQCNSTELLTAEQCVQTVNYVYCWCVTDNTNPLVLPGSETFGFKPVCPIFHDRVNMRFFQRELNEPAKCQQMHALTQLQCGLLNLSSNTGCWITQCMADGNFQQTQCIYINNAQYCWCVDVFGSVRNGSQTFGYSPTCLSRETMPFHSPEDTTQGSLNDVSMDDLVKRRERDIGGEPTAGETISETWTRPEDTTMTYQTDGIEQTYTSDSLESSTETMETIEILPETTETMEDATGTIEMSETTEANGGELSRSVFTPCILKRIEQQQRCSYNLNSRCWIAQCNEQGAFEPQQCILSVFVTITDCWCVDINGTPASTRQKTSPCQGDQDPPPAPTLVPDGLGDDNPSVKRCEYDWLFDCGERCILQLYVCDGVTDCADGKDELPSSCREGLDEADMLVCGKQRIRRIHLCNGWRNCEDGSDEENCHYTDCAKSNIRLPIIDVQDDGHKSICLDEEKYCDGNYDTISGIDELGCSMYCEPLQFYCASSNECMPRTYMCDNFYDCENGIDEDSCPCGEESFHCGMKCIHKADVCNGKIDCIDGSDEDPDICAEVCLENDNTIRCHDTGKCISPHKLCDGVKDCDGFPLDEEYCFTPDDGQCGDDEIACFDVSVCLPKESLCNGINDCGMFPYDEMYCHTLTEGDIQDKHIFICGNVMPYDSLCDGFMDCENGEDEVICLNRGMDMLSICGTMMPYSFICDQYQDCDNGEDEENCGVDTNCRKLDNFQCYDGSCIPNDWLCDEIRDCKAYEDERLCVNLVCSDKEFHCDGFRCIDYSNVCDGMSDCNNALDEQQCLYDYSYSYSMSFSYDYDYSAYGFDCDDRFTFTCLERSCLPLDFICDGDVDCMDSSDELDCGCSHYEEHNIKHIQCPSNGKCMPLQPLCLDPSILCPGFDPNSHPYCSTSEIMELCGENGFLCWKSYTCVPNTHVCNGYSDCKHDEDELICYPCEPVEIQACQFMTMSTTYPTPWGIPKADASVLMTLYNTLAVFNCHPKYVAFGCAVFAPSCKELQGVVVPCYSWCLEIKRSCQGLFMGVFGEWPLELDCQQFEYFGQDNCISADEPMSRFK